MKENRLLLWNKRKVKLIESLWLTTCYNPTPEWMGIRAVISIIQKIPDTE